MLAYLREAKFEPLTQASIVNLSRKVLFLVTLATARRVSEVHSLSGLPQDISFQADGSVQLEFLADFLAKNQAPSDDSPSIRIPSLEVLVCPDDPDRVNCPVRALKIYKNRTDKHRSPGQRRLFISFNLNYTKDVQKPTLARWLIALIKEAYQWALETNLAGYIPLNAPSAHEIRSWSSSLAHANGVPVRQLLAAAYWRNEDVFVNHYLRDGARLMGDGWHGVKTLVAAQTALSSLRS